MKMRVSIARALVSKPEVLLMDEPFAALDDITRQRLNVDLLKWWYGQSMAAMFVTHNVAEAVFLSQRVLVMGARPGKVVAEVRIEQPYPRDASFRQTQAFLQHCQTLGVALAQPARRCFALEGDGSLLMQLGCLATVATLAPKNLTMLIMDNGSYQITGGQATPAAGGADFVAIARGCGLRSAVWATDEADFDAQIDRCLATDGPHLIGLKLDDQPPAAQTERDPPQLRDRFMRGMGVKKSKLPG
jgi:hypothetical protein